MSCDDQGPETATDCTPCSPGIRSRYFRGKLLTVADYDLEQRYMVERRRLINREMLGWGVVSGFRIKPADGKPNGPGDKFSIGPGFALDPRGRELVACDATVLQKPEDVVWLRCVNDQLQSCGPPPGTSDADEPDAAVYVLAAHYAERQIDGVILDGGCGDDVCEANRICETVIYSLTPLCDCPSALPDCPAPRFDCAPKDDADCGPNWDPGWGSMPGKPLIARAAAPCDRGPHRTLAEWSMERVDDDLLCGKVELHRLKGGLAFDPGAGVPLACVTLGYHCDQPYLAEVKDSRGPRRLARPNDSLFDLIRGCDLTRIEAVGWEHLLPPKPAAVEFAKFERMFVGGSTAKPIQPVNTQFWVRFSGPVWAAPLSPAVITVSLFHWESGSAVRFLRRMPIDFLEVAPPLDCDPLGSTRGFRAVVHGNYWMDNIYSTASEFEEAEGTIVEIGVRGGLIVDVHGQLVAAGGGPLPTRPGWPGSDFISVFKVLPYVAPPAPPPSPRRSPR